MSVYKKFLSQNSLLFIFIFLIYELLIIYTKNTISPIHFSPHNFFFLELIGKTINLPTELFFLIGSFNLILIWLISKQLFNNSLSLIPVIIYPISPWTAYLISAESFYIYLLFLILLSGYGLILVHFGRNLLGRILTILGCGLALYSSFLLLFLTPLLLVLLVVFQVIPLKKLRPVLIFLTLLAIPLLFFIYKYPPAYKNIQTNEIKVFSDPGLLNMVNAYEGAAKKEGFGKLGQISQNKYLFSSEDLLLRFGNQLTPATYFSSQEKLLTFSFSPPIYLGFLIPLTYGLYLILKSPLLKKSLLLSTLLTIPSVLGKNPVDLNRLVIFAPIVILLISYGLIKLHEKKKKNATFFLYLTIFLVIFQMLITLQDMQIREPVRFIKYNSQNYEIGNQ